MTAAGQGGGNGPGDHFPGHPRQGQPVDYSNSLCKIHVNNWVEVNNLGFQEFSVRHCCTPDRYNSDRQFTVDHEEMDAGAWSLSYHQLQRHRRRATSHRRFRPGPSPGDRTVLRWGRGLRHHRRGHQRLDQLLLHRVIWSPGPELTTGLFDRPGEDNQKTFCICGHETFALWLPDQRRSGVNMSDGLFWPSSQPGG